MFYKSLGNNPLVESLLLTEAEGDEPETNEPVDTQSNKDITSDKKDIEQDSDDLKQDEEDTTEDGTDSDSEETDSEVSSEDVPSEDETGSEDDSNDDDATDTTEEDTEESKDESKRKQVVLEGLVNIRRTFVNLTDMLDQILLSPLPDSELETIRIIRDKTQNNVDLLNAFLTTSNLTKDKTHADLTTIYNIYVSDLEKIDKTITLFISNNKVLRKSLVNKKKS